MAIIDILLATPIGWVMSLMYDLLQNYGLTILLFTVFVKLIMFPVSILAQKNSIKMVKMQPLIDGLKRKYPDKADKEQFMDE